MSYKTKLRLPEAETGYYKGWHPTVQIEIKDTDKGPALSMSGSIGSERNGGSWGQIDETLAEAFPNNLHVQRIVEVWRKYHLNDMKAGCEHRPRLAYEHTGDRVELDAGLRQSQHAGGSRGRAQGAQGTACHGQCRAGRHKPGVAQPAMPTHDDHS